MAHVGVAALRAKHEMIRTLATDGRTSGAYPRRAILREHSTLGLHGSVNSSPPSPERLMTTYRPKFQGPFHCLHGRGQKHSLKVIIDLLGGSVTMSTVLLQAAQNDARETGIQVSWQCRTDLAKMPIPISK